jgi:hypothetical protein
LPAHSRIVFNASNPQQYIEGTQGLHIHASDAVVIDAGAYTWSFGSDGIFTFPDNSTQSGGSISKSDLKALVSTCTNFTDFKNAIAAL